jgi:hypothetical protein
MRQITKERLSGLLAAQEPPCVSLYQPTHRQHPENQQDPIRYRNMLVDMEKSLREKYPTREVRAILERFQSLARDDRFWNYRSDGLAIFSSPETFEIFELQRPVKELLDVADNFHTKPLLRILQSADRYQILCLTGQEAKLYEGNRDALDPVELTDVPSSIAEVLGDERSPTTQMIGSYGTRTGGGGTAVYHGHGPTTDKFEAETVRFFTAVDRGILEHHSRPSGLPLMLAALPEHHATFRQVSQNPYLIGEGIMANPEALSVDELRQQAWAIVLPIYLARLEELKETFHTARSRDIGSADVADVAKAVMARRVQTLLVEADRIIPGQVDPATGEVRSGRLADPEVGDVIDDLAEAVLRTGGEVVVVPADKMPSDTGLAATFRH